MPRKPIIVHVINSMERGGAETLLVNLLPELSQHYRIVLVTLLPDADFTESEIVCYRRYCIHYTGPSSTLKCALRLRHIIKTYNPILVRAQLFLSSLIARIGTPKKIPLVFSIHSHMSVDCYNKNRFALTVEKLTYSKNHHLIGVSKDALNDFKKYVGVKGAVYTLYNFIRHEFIEKARVRENVNFKTLKLVAVGNVKAVKNYSYLVEAFKMLKSYNISLDIYGNGPMRKQLETDVELYQLPITFKGVRSDIYNVLDNYDLYVMPSIYEGFGIAPIEAMAMGLPLLLSSLSVFKEVTHGNALFCDIKDPQTFVQLIEKIIEGKIDLHRLSVRGIQIARENYQQKDYIHKLNDIYQQVIKVSN